ncbi:MAG: RdgB/HAM1 family non-canonical purine NTP pyrophosphatase [Oscillospiraceae bacterium]|jgi:XTP/dITP diphosphohydrolase|nr:RdgB/HAM1 family non-canonical purine NTP pyrophosphatase [Oscillospiraceae bacterium]
MLTCKYCGSGQVVKSGIVLNKQRHKCKDCGRQFIEGNKKLYSEDQKTLAFKLRLHGVTLIKIAKEIGAPGTGNILQILRAYPHRHVFVATHNTKKQAELTRVLSHHGMQAVTPADLDITLPEVDEAEDSFVGNALLKARSACLVTHLPCVADDSGLLVDALDGAPGVYSARYAGEHGNDSGNMALLLKNLKDVQSEERTARFVCAAVCVYPDGTELIAEGCCEGLIAHSPKGEGGFGYDPVFLPDGKGDQHMSELTPEEKDAISHRGKALTALHLLMWIHAKEMRKAKNAGKK